MLRIPPLLLRFLLIKGRHVGHDSKRTSKLSDGDDDDDDVDDDDDDHVHDNDDDARCLGGWVSVGGSVLG